MSCFETRDQGSNQTVVANLCPLCGDEIPEQCSLAIHLRKDCDANQDDEQTTLDEVGEE